MEDDKLLTLDEASDQFSISRRTLERWVYEDKIPYYKVGGLVRVKPSEIMIKRGGKQ